MTGWARRLAAVAPPPVFAVAGVDARHAVQDLHLLPGLRLVDAPRQASVLLLAGRLTDQLLDAAVAAHDAMPTPRGVVSWQPDGGGPPRGPFTGAELVGDADPVEVIVALHRSLHLGVRASTPTIQPDVDPAPWRGEGPYGQGGSGMTGGVPYGRPMATREDDRDGLSLDALPVPVGPLFTAFPPGMSARVTFKGDLVHRFELGPSPYDDVRREPDVFLRALTEPVAVAALEVARARALLRWTAWALRVQGLDAQAQRVLALARAATPGDEARVRRVRRWVTHPLVTGRQLRAIGRVDTDALAGLAVGPVGRAAGLIDDLRAEDPAYRELGFTPITGQAGDVAARWQQRLSEAEQALDLATRAGSLRTGGVGAIESPRGRLTADSTPTTRLWSLLPELVTGVEWGDAVATLASLDLDLDELPAPIASRDVA
ncbi:MAG: hypothetical protein KG028_11040 [Actinobacteria bacterium]|nr:hypothetical protein [Actinomycetota bacterium]